MHITADSVKRLRERTGAGMMECKRALIEAGGDLDAAAEIMRKSGLAKADNKAARVAAEGRIVFAGSPDMRSGVLAEINCETDFVAREADFVAFADEVASAALASGAATVAALLSAKGRDGASFEERRRTLIAKIGENVSVRRLARLTAPTVLGSYLHGTRIGALVALEGGDASLARDLAMHVAAANPQYVDAARVPPEQLAKEREILLAQAAGEGKPAAIVEKMVEGRLRKFLAEITLVGQPFVKDPDVTVDKLLKQSTARVSDFVRFEVGAGIERKQENFAEEVMAQVKGSAKR
ncbi:MAG TPA: translation elongation factor Ts [Steroidobacteraceae bacterium]|nr:translation elongation factor Ts [Steroidobacteraceae bacterium]